MAVTGGFTNCNCGPGAAACEDPAQPVATVGLCLASGAPIAVTITRDCAGTATQEGWIDLTTGAWSAGAPPEGTRSCDTSAPVGTSGVLCDVLPDGQAAGLVLVEYQYAPDGSVESVRLVNAATGKPYTLQGELRHCPAGVEQPERDLVLLCDTADGAVTEFVRDYARDQNGQIAGFTDYTFDGQPYAPAGSVGACTDEPDGSPGESPTGPPLEVDTGLLCLVDENSGEVVRHVLAEWVYDSSSGERSEVRLVDPVTGESVEVVDGQAITSCPSVETTGGTAVVPLCDVAPDGRVIEFLRHWSYQSGVAEPQPVDTALDGSPYQPVGEVRLCPVELAIDESPGSDESPGWPAPAFGPVLKECRCDDTDGDGIADTAYVELIAVYEDGTLMPLGTYTEDLTGPYTPVSPVACETASSVEPARGAQARRVELAEGATWDAAAVPLLQAVSATAHDGTGTVTTEDGTTPLREGETASWALARDGDAALVGPLTIAADTGTVTITYTAGATL